MTTYIIYSDPTDGHILSRHANYNTARTGSTSTKTVDTGGAWVKAGQNKNWEGYWCYQAFWSFATEAIADNEEIQEATLSVYNGWTNSRHGVLPWTQKFMVRPWTAPLTTAQWVAPTTLATLPHVAWADNWTATTSFMRRYYAHDNLIGNISKTAPLKMVSTSSSLIAGRANEVPAEIWNAGGESTNAPYLVVHTVVPNSLNMVEKAATTLPNGTTISIRSSGGATPTLTIGYNTITGSWTSMGTLDAKFNKTIDGPNSIALTHDSNNNFYVVGTGSSVGSIVTQAYEYEGGNFWTAKPAASSQIPAGNGMIIRSVAACVMGGTSTTDRPSLRVLAARGSSHTPHHESTHIYGSAWAHAASFDLSRVLSGNSNPLINANNGAQGIRDIGVPGTLDVVALSPNVYATYAARGKFGNAVVGGLTTLAVYNGVGQSTPLGVNRDYIPTNASQLLAINDKTFAHVYDAGGVKLVVDFYNVNCQRLGSAEISADLFNAGVIGTKWAAHYDDIAGLVRIYFINATAGARALSRADISTTTYAQTITANVTTTLGATGSTNSTLRIATNPDERRVAIDAANVSSTGVNSVQTFYSTAGNVTPVVPRVVQRTSFDATFAADFTWTFSDSNPGDFQTKYQVEISRVSDSVVVHDSGTITSGSATYTLPANVLTNGTQYRWRVRLTDSVGGVGAWSQYETFMASATGLLSITNPAVDNQAGIETSSYSVQWNYTGAQGQRRVLVTRVVDGVVHSDTGMQTSSSSYHIITGLLSGLEYIIEVFLINTDGIVVPSVTRRITPDYATPKVPSLELTAYTDYVEVLVINPLPTGDRPEVIHNDIYRRENKYGASTRDFIKIGTTNNNGIFRDYSVKSDKVYDYYVVGRDS